MIVDFHAHTFPDRIAAAAVVLFVALIYLFPSLFSFLREPEEVERLFYAPVAHDLLHRG